MHSADKAELRAVLLAARRARRPKEIERAREAVRSAVLVQQAAQGWRCVAAYLPLRTEPGSVELLAELHARGVRVLVPVLLPDRDLDWAEWPGTVAQPDAVAQPGTIGQVGAPLGVVGQAGAPLGVDAVGAADAVLAPALAVAADGTRLGRGGGSYDRALRRARVGATVAALVYDTELLTSLPAEPWDVPVGAAVTPSGWRDLVHT